MIPWDGMGTCSNVTRAMFSTINSVLTGSEWRTRRETREIGNSETVSSLGKSRRKPSHVEAELSLEILDSPNFW